MAVSLDISVGFPVFVGDGGERSHSPGGVCLVEEARSPWNKLLLAVFHLAVKRSGADGRPVELRFAGSGGSSVRRCSAPFLVVVEAAVGDDFGRMSASSSRLDVFLRCVVWLLRPSVTGTTGRTILLGLCCIFYFLQGCLCKIWNVNFMIYL